MKDRILKCKDCGKDFIFTTGEQKYCARKGKDKPVRCEGCREALRNKSVQGKRETFEITCMACGDIARLSSRPRAGSHPYYCKDCFERYGMAINEKNWEGVRQFAYSLRVEF